MKKYFSSTDQILNEISAQRKPQLFMMDDAIDALVLAISGYLSSSTHHPLHSLPSNPPFDSLNIPMEITYYDAST
jgi:predicted RNase H-like nuclease